MSGPLYEIPSRARMGRVRYAACTGRTPTLEDRLLDIAENLGKLRRATVETPFDWQVDRLCKDMETVVFEYEPHASDLIRAGFTVEQALRYVDNSALRIRRLLGEPDQMLRWSGLID